MASFSNPPSAVSPEELRNWLELPQDVTASILSRLGTIDVLMSAQKVCTLWFKICKDPLIFRTIDMHNDDDSDCEEDFEDLCRVAVNRSAGQLVDINIEHFGSDGLLEHIASRCTQIKRLRLASNDFIFNEGFIEAIDRLPLLEEIDLTHCYFSKDTVGTIGRYCPHLKSFKLNCHPSRDRYKNFEQEADASGEAFAIARNMPALHHLQLIGNPMTNWGLQLILNGCPHLKSLDLRQCLNLNLSEGGLGEKCAEKVKFLRLPHESAQDCGFDITECSDDGSHDEMDYSFWLDDDDFGGGYYGGVGADDYCGCGYDSLDYDD